MHVRYASFVSRTSACLQLLNSFMFIGFFGFLDVDPNSFCLLSVGFVAGFASFAIASFHTPLQPKRSSDEGLERTMQILNLAKHVHVRALPLMGVRASDTRTDWSAEWR